MTETHLIERTVVLAVSLLVVGLLAFFFVRSLKTDRRRKPRTRRPDVITTCGSAVVSYQPNPKRLDTFLFSGGEQGVSQKLREILDANPQADLSQLQDALGIIVTGVQRYKRPQAEIEGIELGDKVE